ncbi:hypothetical protein B0T25DRAFT_565960 [Lasiosphaeria hispida]|uniref:Uncharacterized protein n=1 Tax=Lasiosphaeria hispida TaxID=260671 RepID=A0AAJ0HKJ9_9PEZI|nr:hypothetical protein B0T25DRAFT_565960 [Lasiosphaeria hispida]
MSNLYFVKTTNPGSNQPAGNFVSGYSLTDRDHGVFRVGPKGLYFVKTNNVGSGKIEVHRTTASSNYRDFDIHTASVFELADNGTWTVVNADLFLIKTRNCASRLIEVHRANASSFSAFLLHAAVPISQTEGENGAWDIYNGNLYFINTYDGDNGSWRVGSQGSLCFIKPRNTGSGKIEVHIASSESKYQQVSHHATWISQADGLFGTYVIA